MSEDNANRDQPLPILSTHEAKPIAATASTTEKPEQTASIESTKKSDNDITDGNDIAENNGADKEVTPTNALAAKESKDSDTLLSYSEGAVQQEAKEGLLQIGVNDSDLNKQSQTTKDLRNSGENQKGTQNSDSQQVERQSDTVASSEELPTEGVEQEQTQEGFTDEQQTGNKPTNVDEPLRETKSQEQSNHIQEDSDGDSKNQQSQLKGSLEKSFSHQELPTVVKEDQKGYNILLPGKSSNREAATKEQALSNELIQPSTAITLEEQEEFNDSTAIAQTGKSSDEKTSRIENYLTDSTVPKPVVNQSTAQHTSNEISGAIQKHQEKGDTLQSNEQEPDKQQKMVPTSADIEMKDVADSSTNDKIAAEHENTNTVKQEEEAAIKQQHDDLRASSHSNLQLKNNQQLPLDKPLLVDQQTKDIPKKQQDSTKPAKPAEAKPAEAKPAEAKPAESKPAEAEVKKLAVPPEDLITIDDVSDDDDDLDYVYDILISHLDEARNINELATKKTIEKEEEIPKELLEDEDDVNKDKPVEAAEKPEKIEEDEEELEPIPSNLNPLTNREKQGLLMKNFNSDQSTRYEAYKRSALSKSFIKKISTTMLGQNLPVPVHYAISGLAKYFVMELLEKARDVYETHEKVNLADRLTEKRELKLKKLKKEVSGKKKQKLNNGEAAPGASESSINISNTLAENKPQKLNHTKVFPAPGSNPIDVSKIQLTRNPFAKKNDLKKEIDVKRQENEKAKEEEVEEEVEVKLPTEAPPLLPFHIREAFRLYKFEKGYPTNNWRQQGEGNGWMFR